MGFQNIYFPKGTRFLVTGGAGFIGSNLIEALLNKGYFVRALDNFSIGKKENIEEFMNDKNFEFIKGDIRDIQICQDVCKGIDYILHQAAWGSVPRSIEMPLLYEEINIKGTLNVMTAARDNGVKRFVYASSSSVYGDEPNLPKVEGREGNLLSPYAITKKVNELYAKNYFDLYGLETIGMRYFNVFGKKQDPHSYYSAVIPKFVNLLLNNESPTINGDGENSRDFTYIDNVIEANLRACLASKKACGGVYNIAYGGRVSLNELYETLKNLLDKDVKPIYGPNRKGDIKHSNADISNARELLDYNPSYSFDDGIKLTIDWYKKNL
ncbi:SDR family oxidoreductase [Romboutsia sedimentorum]|uniref:SDR family oxidoreductase n=1 Tax=Romboutsia sedimentorum TaxID=1368474 RepID=A0ABT7E6F1_9FIRM|nr:SDR family oxidoreductase [Romboutsia sedimentorum]MDK2562252.1 SDR family oxidoreductase [Romboutsia sedimentorum]